MSVGMSVGLSKGEAARKARGNDRKGRGFPGRRRGGRPRAFLPSFVEILLSGWPIGAVSEDRGVRPHVAISAALSTALPTIARKRMAALACSAAIFTLVNGAFDVVGPLWATSDLGLDAAGWAHLRSMRMAGTFIGIAMLGVVSEHIGARLMGAIAMGLGALALAAMAGSPTAATVAMPVFGACISAGYVNLNVLTQGVSTTRQGLANALYRGVGAATAIVAPTAALAAAVHFGSYGEALRIGAAVLAVGGLVLLAYPLPRRGEPTPPLGALLAGYAQALRRRPLVAFVALEQCWYATQLAVVSFAAIRLTRELGLATPAFGALCTAIAITGLAGTLVSGAAEARLGTRRLLALVWSGASACELVMGFTDSLPVTMAAYAAFCTILAFGAVPGSMWVSRAAGAGSQTTAFTVYKIGGAGISAAAIGALGFLEPHTGMRSLFWCGGLLGLPFCLAILRLGNGNSADPSMRAPHTALPGTTR